MLRKAYPSDVSDDEWGFVAPYLTLMIENAPQRERALREIFNGLRWVVRAGASWRMLPHDLPPWEAVYQQTQRWIQAGGFESMTHDLRVLLRVAAGRNEQPSVTPFSTAVRCNRRRKARRRKARRRKAAVVRAMTEPSARRAARFTRR